MVGIPGLYFVIACEDHARFVRPDPDNGLHTVEVVDLTTLHQGDGPATDPTFVTGSPDPHEWQSVRFARLLAARIDEDFAVDLFSHMVLVAPPDTLRALLALIDGSTGACLYGSLAKNLIAVPDLELWPHLLPWLPPGQISSPLVVPSSG